MELQWVTVNEVLGHILHIIKALYSISDTIIYWNHIFNNLETKSCCLKKIQSLKWKLHEDCEDFMWFLYFMQTWQTWMRWSIFLGYSVGDSFKICQNFNHSLSWAASEATPAQMACWMSMSVGGWVKPWLLSQLETMAWGSTGNLVLFIYFNDFSSL